MMMRPGDILGRIFFILSQKSIIGSSGFIHGAHGIFIHGGQDFLVATLEILEEIFNKEWPGPEMLWIHGGHGSSDCFR